MEQAYANQEKANPNAGRWRAAIAIVGPAILLIGMLYHPFMASFADDHAVGAIAAADETRWAAAHMIVAAGYGLVAAAFVALRDHLRQAGEDRGSSWGLPFIVVASALFAFLPALELAPLAAIHSGGDVGLAQAAIDRWFTPAMIAGSLLFAVGTLGFGIGVRKSHILGAGATRVVTVGLVVMTFARVPSSFALYAWAASSVVVFVPLAHAMWSSTRARTPTPRQTAA